ncbi:carboxypeptidase-like regulatory domain-containing protein [Segetibacter sp. 3557_3]|uniref:DUF5686 and carboxypeptidase regulatory-like domain-containing protein n=1 Tax=Segetibacter sp. 3557_3 TaxID=2547429 RepID=UPI001058848A|nr:DUF5686 and carboxypeptidase regulatory-like domain-containing protein [Segetibacter sp. 3557_3]TDH28026.1 carboxypeptidase-like regulatory domain-containing protein [Segetibacter sp. 3557_3]
MRLFLVFLLLSLYQLAIAGKVTGLITDSLNAPLPFSSVIIKGTTKGTSANNIGVYSLTLPAGEYTLLCQHIGYKPAELKVVVAGGDSRVDFKLAEQQYNLDAVTIKNGEDPAYAIIRNAIRKRSYYENELKRFQADVYIKGQFSFRDYPNRIFGRPVDLEDGDTSKRKMIFLSETLARYSVDNKRSKVEVLSTRVSGDKDAFGFSNPQIISFYANNINLVTLNPRGFISPIASSALNYYNYHFEGTFFESGKMINRIKASPKRKYEPLFNGYINIIEDDWRIHSVDLFLFRENQMQLADTLKIEQVYIPVGNVWVIKQQTIYPSIDVLGVKAAGSFVQVYENFNLDPAFSPGFFNNTILKVYDSANKKTALYWDTIRPVPLLAEEQLDYKKKDSLELAGQDPRYKDSLDRVRNKPNIVALLTTGQTFSNSNRHTSVKVDALADVLNFNTVEGAVINLSPVITYRRRENGRSSFSLTPNARFGFSSKRFNAHLTGTYTFGKKYLSSVTLSGGRRIFQVDNTSPVASRTNTFSTLLWENNLIKLYEARFGRLTVSKGLGDGLTIGAGFQFQDRVGLQNTTLHKWRDIKEREFTPNLYFQNHQAAIASVNLTWQPGAKYIELPGSKINVGSRFPTVSLSIVSGIKNVLESDVDYTKWKAGITDKLDIKLAGRFDYRITAGGFLNRKQVFLPDYQHYFGNQTNTAAPYLNSFQLMPYYSFSNTERFQATAHVEYHLNGFLTNKIPVFKKLNWFLVSGNNTLYLNNRDVYTEVFAGLENIFKVFRIDFVKSFSNSRVGATTGLRFSLPGVLSGEAD